MVGQSDFHMHAHTTHEHTLSHHTRMGICLWHNFAAFVKSYHSQQSGAVLITSAFFAPRSISHSQPRTRAHTDRTLQAAATSAPWACAACTFLVPPLINVSRLVGFLIVSASNHPSL